MFTVDENIEKKVPVGIFLCILLQPTTPQNDKLPETVVVDFLDRFMYDSTYSLQVISNCYIVFWATVVLKYWLARSKHQFVAILHSVAERDRKSVV